jgi:predicted esterase YcpF (UPF0227 family)
MPLEKIDKTLRKIDKVVGKKIGEAARTAVNVGKKVGNYYADRLTGLAEAVKEGFEHTNPARVKMSPDESMEDKTKDLPPASDKDIEKIQEKMNKIGRKPPKEETLIDI